ncbi:MAG: hypothetical protein ABEJ72_07940 [Candidatus Aenigmatarchaeota archaeon]
MESECDLVVADVSRPSTGLGIELGWADFFQVPILLIAEEGAEPSRSLEAVGDEIRFYEDGADMVKIVSLKIEKLS